MILIESEAKSKFDRTLFGCADVLHWGRFYTKNELEIGGSAELSEAVVFIVIYL